MSAMMLRVMWTNTQTESWAAPGNSEHTAPVLLSSPALRRGGICTWQKRTMKHQKKTIRESTEEYLGGDFWFSNIRKFAQIFCLLKLFTDAARLWANRLQKTSRTKHWITFPDATPGDSTQESAGMTQEHISYVLKNLWFCHGNYFLWNRGMKWPELWHPPSVFFNKCMESIHLQFQPLLKQSTFFTSWIQIPFKLKVLVFFFKKLMWTQ